MTARFSLLARTGQMDFLSLPWSTPLAEWSDDRLVDLARGISRHVVRFVAAEGRIYALKEIDERLARKEYGLLRRLVDEGLPAVEAVAVVSDRRTPGGEPLDAVLITRHLSYSLPYRYLFRQRPVPDVQDRLLDALAVLLVRLHLVGFFWGDCSLSNVLFRRDAGSLSAYLVDAETGEFRPELSPARRGHELDLASTNLAGELLDLAAADRLPSEVDPMATSDDLVRRYEGLWDELTEEEVFEEGDRYRIDARLERLNDLGFDASELELVSEDDGHHLRLQPRVVEEGHHHRRLRELTGLDVQENQARRLLNDIAAFRASLERDDGQPMSEMVAAYRWLTDVFEPLTRRMGGAQPGKREAPELFHELLEHRWYLSEQRGGDVDTNEALDSYLDTVLPGSLAEESVVPADTTGEHRAL